MEIIKKTAINYEIFDNNIYVEYLKLKDNKKVSSYGKIVKKLTRNLYIINDVKTKENYRINKTDILNKMEWLEEEELKSNDFTFLLIGFLITIGFLLSILVTLFSSVSLDITIKKFINDINISMFGLNDWMKNIKYN